MECLILITSFFCGVGAMLPLVVWHGIRDDCADLRARFISKINIVAPDLYVHCIQIGSTAKKDYENSIYMKAHKQVETACRHVWRDDKLSNGFNALGLSQGGLLLRALIQKCPPSKINNFVTFSSPQQGVFGIPKCFNALNDWTCRFVTKSLGTAAYADFAQRLFTPAQYWHDPTKEKKYRKKSFAADLNNEGDFHPYYRENLLKVNKFVLVRNIEDDVIVPRESSHFGYYREGQKKDVVNFTETRVYKEDLIGLKELYKTGRLIFKEIPGKHMDYTDAWLARLTYEYFMK